MQLHLHLSQRSSAGAGTWGHGHDRTALGPQLLSTARAGRVGCPCSHTTGPHGSHTPCGGDSLCCRGRATKPTRDVPAKATSAKAGKLNTKVLSLKSEHSAVSQLPAPIAAFGGHWGPIGLGRRE